MKYLPCSLLLSRFHTWGFLEQQEHLTFTTWSLMRLEIENLYFTLTLSVTCISNCPSVTLLWQFVSPTRFSHIYSENLVHLPHCYFVNDYKQVSIWTLKTCLYCISLYYGGTQNACYNFIRKTVMYWIQTANPGGQIMDCRRTSLYLLVSISFTRWTLKYLQLGNVYWFCYYCSCAIWCHT